MKRYVLRLEFDGTPFCGWQIQDKERELAHKASIQSVVEEQLQILLRSPEKIYVQGCGRTDAGVHAEEFFCHFDFIDENLDTEKIRHGLNALLPTEISALSCFEAPPNFHAIESVLEKNYRYQILIRRTKPSFLKNQAWWFPMTLENFSIDKIKEASQDILGSHDFFAFSAAGSSVKTTVRCVNNVDIELKALGDDPCFGHQLNLEFKGRGFLKHMVRLLTGTLCEIATGKRDLHFISETLKLPHNNSFEKLPRLLCAPPQGLFLAKVKYEKT